MAGAQGEWLISVGAGVEQLPAIVEAQRLGFAVLAVDGNSSAAGLQVADEGIVVDLRNADAVLSRARSRAVCGTLPVPIGRSLTTQARIHDALGLRGVSEKAAANCVDKFAFHARMVEAGVPVPAQTEYATFDELKTRDIREDDFPVVLKPRFGSGSVGVRVLTSVVDWTHLRDHIDPHLYGEGALVQAFVEGMTLGIDGAIRNGELSLTLVRQKILTPPPDRLELNYRAPADLTNDRVAIIRRTLARALEGLGVSHSVFHADAIWTADNRLVLIELSARPAGLGITSELVPACVGIAFVAQAIALHVFGDGAFEPLASRPTLLRYWNVGTGIVRRVPTVGQLLAIPGVIGAECGLVAGQALHAPRTLDDLVGPGHLLISAGTWTDVEAAENEVLSLFEMESHRDVA